jgi:hypothetical protein
MQSRVHLHRRRPCLEQAQPLISAAEHSGSRVHTPLRALCQRFTPRSQTSLAGIDLLAIADQRHDNCPVAVAPHDVEKERGLAGRATKLATTKCSAPRALRLIEYNDVLMRWHQAIDVVAQKTHERLYGAFGLLPCHAETTALSVGIAGESLAHTIYQGADCR